VGYAFKKRRYLELHRAALRFPSSRFFYIGIDDSGDVTPFYNGEHEQSFVPFQKDLYACHDDLLLAKRKGRNPFRRVPPYLVSAPEISGLLDWCPVDGVALYGGSLPWYDDYSHSL
jgi:hypothetical protein